MQIRLACSSDAAELEDFLVFNNGEKNRELAKCYIHAMFSSDFRKPQFVVTTNENTIIGAAAFSEEFFTTGVWGISWVSVHESHRNKGLGGQLLSACIDQISKKAPRPATIILATYPGKTALYERYGFQVSGEDHEGGAFMTLVINA